MLLSPSSNQMITEITNCMEVTDSRQGTNLELRIWYPYENSQERNPVKSIVSVDVFTARNSSDIRRNEIINIYYDKHWQERPISVCIETNTFFIRRARMKEGLTNLCKGLFSLNARIYYSIAHRQAVCNLPGGYSTILSHKEVYCSNWFLSDDARWACL
jgi:hypothetical protein